MKTNNLLLRSLMALVALLGCMSASAYDFYAENEQGQKIYCTVMDATANTVWVSCVGNDGSVYSQYTDLVIPSTVVRSSNNTTYTVVGIGSNAFKNARCYSITLPNTIVSILPYAFNNCIYLTSLTIPENVTSIGYELVVGCTKLEKLYYNAIHANPSQNTNVFRFLPIAK